MEILSKEVWLKWKLKAKGNCSRILTKSSNTLEGLKMV